MVLEPFSNVRPPHQQPTEIRSMGTCFYTTVPGFCNNSQLSLLLPRLGSTVPQYRAGKDSSSAASSTSPLVRWLLEWNIRSCLSPSPVTDCRSCLFIRQPEDLKSAYIHLYAKGSSMQSSTPSNNPDLEITLAAFYDSWTLNKLHGTARPIAPFPSPVLPGLRLYSQGN